MANVIKHKRGSGSDPGASDLVVGEVAIRTDVGKLFTKMDNGSVAEIAGGGSDIAINTLSSSSGTGGGSATFNGSAYRFTLSQPPSVSAQQLLVSINGVIQKPVAGTGQPSEGFSVDGTDIILGDAPATGSDFFILTFKSLGVSEPADNSVTSAKIVDGAIVNADINASAAIAGTKISPTFNSTVQLNIPVPSIEFNSTTHDNDFRIINYQGNFIVQDTDATANRFEIASDGTVNFLNNVNANSGLDVTGAITGTGDLTIDTNTLHVDSTNNRVGIGTTSPATLLVLNHATNPAIRFQDSGTKVASINSEGTDTNIASFEGKDMVFATSDSSAFSERMRIDATTGTLKFSKSVYGDQGSEDFYRIKFNDVGGTGNDVGIGQPDSSSIGFNTVSNGSIRFYQGTDDEVMRIHNNKYVGIGTTSPDALLDVVNTGGAAEIICSSSTQPRLMLKTSGTTAECRVDFGDSGDSSRGAIGYNHSDDALKFYTTGVANERMRIDSSGRVGIGTSSPGARLTIEGAADNVNSELRLTATGVASGYLGSDSNGLNIGTDTAGLIFKTGVTGGGSVGATGTERMRIDSSGRLIVGATSGAGKFIVQDSSLPKIQANFNGTAHLESGVGGSGGGFAITTGHFLTFNHQPYANRGTDTNLTERMRILSDGAVCINATSRPVVGTEFLGVQGGSASNSVGIAAAVSHNEGIPFFASNSSNSFADRLMRFAAGSGGDVRGTIIFNGSAMVYGGTSDYRLKENITSISDGITKLKSLNPINFNWIKDETNTNIMGFLAHEVQAVMPEAVAGKKDAVDSKGKEDYQEMDYGRITPLIVAALQEAIARIEILEAK